MKQGKMNRRNALGIIAGGLTVPVLFDPFQALLNGIVNGLIQQAQASENPASTQARNYFFISSPGGPPRWVFDLPLSPYKNNSITPNGKVVTAVSSKGLLSYETTAITVAGKKLYMPLLWSSTIPTSSGGEIPMSTLLNNMMIFRGVDLKSDGHDENYRKHIQPNSQGPSLHGLVTDRAQTPIPSVVTNSRLFEAYRSKSGVGSVLGIGNREGLTSLISPFTRDSASKPDYLNRRYAIESAMNQALNALGAFARSRNPGADGLYRMTAQAESLLKKGVGQVLSEYDVLFEKYRNLLLRCRGLNYPGITGKKLQISETSPVYGTTSKGMIQMNGKTLDYLFKEMEINSFAENFAIAECLFRNNLSTSFACSLGSTVFKNPINNASISWSNDEHDGGAVGSTLVYSFYYRALSACIYEFSQAIGEEKFSETVIHYTGEFNRSARKDGSGSDHGHRGHVTSVFSGIIKEPTIFGETRETPAISTSPYVGSWGYSAMVGQLVRSLTIEDVSSTIATLLRVESPTSNVRSLIQISQSTDHIQKMIDESEKG